MREDQFRQWFRQSVVADEKGRPAIVLHATDDPWFSPELRYGMGPHFADAHTAETRLMQRSPGDAEVSDGVLFAAYLCIENPFYMRDVHFDEFPTFIESVLEVGAIPEDKIWDTCGNRASWYQVSQQENQAQIGRVVQLIHQHGYDGIAYRNYIEGGGSVTWIPFSLDQIWEVPETQLAVDTPRWRRTTRSFS